MSYLSNFRGIAAIVLAIHVMSSAFGQDVTTSFEFTDTDGEFTLGTSPNSVTFQDGEARSLFQRSLYRTGLNSWMVGSGNTGMITFETPAAEVDFFFKDENLAVQSMVTLFDASDQVIVTFNGSPNGPDGMGFTRVQSSDASVRRITVRNNAAGGGASPWVVVDDFEFRAGQVNNPPTADAGPDQFFSAGKRVTLSGSGSDPDGGFLEFSWTQLSGPSVTLASPNSPSTTFTAPDVGEDDVLVFRLTVTDSQGASDTDDVVATIVSFIKFPQLALGGGFELTLIISNETDKAWEGQALLRKGNNEAWSTPWAINGTDRTGASEFDIILNPRATNKFVLTGSDVVETGFLALFAENGFSSEDVAVSFFYNFGSSGQLSDSTGTPPSVEATTFTFSVERTPVVNTAFAFALFGDADAFNMTLILFDEEGNLVQETTLTYEGHLARFFTEVFDEVPVDFLGSMVLEAEIPLCLVVLRLENTSGGGFQLTSIPADIAAP